MAFEETDLLETQCQNQIDGGLHGLWQAIGIVSNAPQFASILGWIGKAALALDVEILNELIKWDGGDLL